MTGYDQNMRDAGRLGAIGDQDVGPLGAYLRARRAVISPEEVGISPSSRRRVTGLTREEVAVRAGVSVEYFTRLEQGKDRRPSESVVFALATALQLDQAATAYLAQLARVSIDPDFPLADEVPDRVASLVSAWTHTPSFVIDRVGNVLCSAKLVAELTPACVAGKNMFCEIFLNPAAKERYVSWPQFTAVLVAGLRATIGGALHDDDIVELVGALTSGSSRFASLWQRQDATPPSGGRTKVSHPEEGTIELNVTNLNIAETTLNLVVYQPAGIDDVAKLERIRSRRDLQ